MSTAIVHNRESASELARLLDAARPRLAMVIPKDMSVDRVIGVIQNEFARNPRLRECDPPSVVRAVVQATELGLDPSPKLGQVWFIPRGKKVKGEWRQTCEMQLGYKGALKKAYESDRILSVDAVVVCANDRFEIQRGTHPDVVHEYKLDARGDVVGAYFAARLTPHEGNIWRVDHMTLDEIVSIRDRSDGYRAFKAGRIKSNPWETDFDEMARKTMLVRGLKTCPISDSFRAALEADADDMRAAHAASQEPSTRAADLKSKLGITPPDAVDADVEEDADDEDA
jgi:recombination protein RecT